MLSPTAVDGKIEVNPSKKMDSSALTVSFDEETHGNKIIRKARENPMLPLGLAGCIIACAVGAYKFKRRGDMSMSVFLMQLRVAAQGTVVGFLTLGLGYSMINEYLIKPKSKD
uniref:HIG1 domain-containing protein n=1 Tax=Timema monikensis TaxID=170555 RepID=A0A7R9DZ31_9NEOP|nr:unnamed protein product [Timema monikensis]